MSVQALNTAALYSVCHVLFHFKDFVWTNSTACTCHISIILSVDLKKNTAQCMKVIPTGTR